MPDRFATAVWLNPAAMRQCRTFFAKCDTPLLLLDDRFHESCQLS